MDTRITVFTPTYNRAYTLPKLYQSLLDQTNKDFVWLIVDDGSTDDTGSMVTRWKAEQKIAIEYVFQENQGKSMAHNLGVKMTKTELFTCVDSDDYLVDSAIAEILACWDSAQEANVGILAFKRTASESLTRFTRAHSETHSTLRNAYSNLGLTGDTMLIFRTSVISKYEFPRFEGERFVPEAYLYDLIDQDGSLILLEKALYVAEYLDDGYTKNMARLLKRNPKGYLAYINQRLRLETALRERAADTIRYIAMAIVDSQKGIVTNAVYPLIAALLYPAGWVLYYKRYRNV